MMQMPRDLPVLEPVYRRVERLMVHTVYVENMLGQVGQHVIAEATVTGLHPWRLNIEVDGIVSAHHAVACVAAATARVQMALDDGVVVRGNDWREDAQRRLEEAQQDPF
jgi:hypothetical protein